MRYALLVLFGLVGVILLVGCMQQAPASTTTNPPSYTPQPAAANVTANMSQPTPQPGANATAGNASQMPTRCITNAPGVHIGGGTITMNGVTYEVVNCPSGTSCDLTTGTCQ